MNLSECQSKFFSQDASHDLDDIPDVELEKMPDLHSSRVENEGFGENRTERVEHGGTVVMAESIVDLSGEAITDLLRSAKIEVAPWSLEKNGFTSTFHGLVMLETGELVPSGQPTGTCVSTKLYPSEKSAVKRFTSSYSSQLYNWSALGTVAFQGKVNVPGLFKLGAQSSLSMQEVVDTSNQVALNEASLLLPMGTVDLEGSLEPSLEFISALTQAVEQKDPIGILNALSNFGHFVALSTTLGGRIDLTETFQRDDKFQGDSVLFRFKEAANMLLDGVSASEQVSISTDVNSRTTVTVEQRNMLLVVTGGDGPAASTIMKSEQDKWLQSLASHKTWRPIGYGENSLIPSLELFRGQDYLYQPCMEILRKYFKERLIDKATEIPVGNNRPDGGSAREYSDKEISIESRIAKMYFDFDSEGVVRFMTVHQTGNALSYPDTWNGGNPVDPPPSKIKTKNYDQFHFFELEKGDEIVAVDVVGEGPIQALVFHTARGRRFPNLNAYGIDLTHVKPERVIRLSAPRIRGFCGYGAKRLDSFGLRWLELDRPEKGIRVPLLVLEPYLFQ